MGDMIGIGNLCTRVIIHVKQLAPGIILVVRHHRVVLIPQLHHIALRVEHIRILRAPAVVFPAVRRVIERLLRPALVIREDGSLISPFLLRQPHAGPKIRIAGAAVTFS